MAHGRRRRRRLKRSAGAGRDRGQSTVEYLLLLVAFLAVMAALALVWRAAQDGRLMGLATSAASHGAGQGMVGMLKDVAEF